MTILTKKQFLIYKRFPRTYGKRNTSIIVILGRVSATLVGADAIQIFINWKYQPRSSSYLFLKRSLLIPMVRERILEPQYQPQSKHTLKKSFSIK
jgi:hypothetical protein